MTFSFLEKNYLLVVILLLNNFFVVFGGERWLKWLRDTFVTVCSSMIPCKVLRYSFKFPGSICILIQNQKLHCQNDTKISVDNCAISQVGVWGGGVQKKKNLLKEVTEMTKSWEFKGSTNTTITCLH